MNLHSHRNPPSKLIAEIVEFKGRIRNGWKQLESTTSKETWGKGIKDDAQFTQNPPFS